MSKKFDRNNFFSKSSSNELFDTETIKHDLKKRSVQGGITTISAQGIKFILTLLSNIWLARILTPSDYGLIGMVMVVIGFITQFKSLGLSMATVQKEEINHQQISTLFWINTGISLCITVITISLSPLIALVYAEPRLVHITMMLSIGTSISGLGIQHAALLKRHMRYTQLAINEILSLGLGLGAALWAASSGLGYWALVIYPLSKETISTIGYWLVSGWIPGLPKWEKGVGSMLFFGGNLASFTMINYFSRNLDNFLIGKVWGAYQLGIYSKAYQLFTLPLKQILQPLTSVAVPVLSRLTSSPEAFRKNYLRILEKVLILTMPLVIFMLMSANWLIILLLGPNWAEITPVFQWLSVAGIFQPIASSTGWIFISQGKTDKMLRWAVIGSSITVVSFLVGLPWGSVGVAASYSLVTLFLKTPLLLWYVGEHSPIHSKDFYRTGAPMFLSTIATFIVLLLFNNNFYLNTSFNQCLVLFFITMISFLGILYIIPKGRDAIEDCFKLAASLV